ncbi:MAG: MFS transporter [Deltaproteobacteria bacterium]|nr:MFS transporter [Deltaproteobacteria bacterium]
MNQFLLLRSTRFWPLFGTQFFGALNDNLFKNALMILIVFHSAETSEAQRTSLVALCQGLFILPFFLFSALAGQLADRCEKSRLVRFVKLAEIAIMGLALIAFHYHSLAGLLVVLTLMGLHSTVFGPIKFSLLPQHLHADELIGGNGMIEMGTFLAILLGTILGGVLMALPNGAHIVPLTAIGVAMLGWGFSRGIPTAPPLDHTTVATWNPLRLTYALVRDARRHRTIFLSILGISWFWFFGAMLLTLLPSFGKDVLGSRESVVTLCLVMFCVGIGIGSLGCERLSGKRVELGLVPFGSIGMTLFTLDLAWASPQFHGNASGPLGVAAFLHSVGSWRILIDLVGISIFSGFFVVPLQALIQQRSAPERRSRIIAANNIINAVFVVSSALLTMLLTQLHCSIPQMFLVLAILNAAVASYIYGIIPEFLYRFMIWILMHSLYRLEVEGAERIPEHGPVVLVCNHVSFVDGLIVAAACRRPARFIMDHYIAAHPIISYFAKRGRAIPIASKRENPDVLGSAYDAIAQALQEGDVVCIFPEGKLTHDGAMNPFKPGIERIIERTPAPVIPMALQGLWGSAFSRMPGRTVWRFLQRLRSHIRLVIAEPLPPTQVRAADLQERVAALRGTHL